ncbi:replication initiation protein, partial [Escherichia coli]|uniref:replication initiation protein n=3 Tax=Enterobacteriaceae TaxID=543 RepID=UPI00396599D7
MGSCAAPSAKGDDKFITTDYLQQCRGIWEIEFNHKLLRYIYGLTNQFTTYSLRDCGSLRNPRTIRLYESL